MTDEQKKIIGQLYLEMYDKLFHYANASLHDPALSEETVQEVFQIACSKPCDVLNSPNPKGWLKITLKNVLKNLKRRQISASNLLLNLGVQEIREITGKSDELALNVLYGKLSETKDFQLIQELADGKSVRQLADERGISENACKKRIQRAKEALRKRI